MQKSILNNFSGVLNLQGLEEGYDSMFSVNENIVTVIPLDAECRKEIDKLSYLNKSNQEDQWLYGLSEDNCCVAILKKSQLNTGFSSGINLGTAKFVTPLIAKNTQVGYVELSKFDSIEFYGGIVDILHTPGLAIEEKYSEKSILFNDKSDYTREFDVEVNGEEFKISYSVSTADLWMETGRVPDLRNSIHSILRFDFKTEHELCDIEKYYSYAMHLFQFCTGRLNVRSEIRLYKKEQNQPILLRFIDSFNDYADDVLNFTQVIRFQFLNDLFPNLFKILNEENTQPYLLFLPQQNKDANSIIYTNVSDVCVAFEREYNFLKLDSKSAAEVEASQSLTAHLIEEIDKAVNCPDTIKTKAKNILNSQLKSFSPSLKEKIVCIYEELIENAKVITDQENQRHHKTCEFYEIGKFKEKVNQFVAMRNKASHSGIVWNDGIEIFGDIKLCIYYCVLMRSGFSFEHSAKMLSWLFNRQI